MMRGVILWALEVENIACRGLSQRSMNFALHSSARRVIAVTEIVHRQLIFFNTS